MKIRRYPLEWARKTSRALEVTRLMVPSVKQLQFALGEKNRVWSRVFSLGKDSKVQLSHSEQGVLTISQAQA